MDYNTLNIEQKYDMYNKILSLGYKKSYYNL